MKISIKTQEHLIDLDIRALQTQDYRREVDFQIKEDQIR